jgi:hypothetical protein
VGLSVCVCVSPPQSPSLLSNSSMRCNFLSFWCQFYGMNVLCTRRNAICESMSFASLCTSMYKLKKKILSLCVYIQTHMPQQI